MKKSISLIGLVALVIFGLAHFAIAQYQDQDQKPSPASFERQASRGFGPGDDMRGGGRSMGRRGGKGMGGMKMPRFWKDPELVENLALTEVQLTALDDLDWKYREKGVELHAAMQKAQLTLEKAMKDATDEKAVKNAAKSVSKVHEQLFMAQLDHQLEIRKLLTDDQWKKIQAMPQRPMRDRAKRSGLKRQ